MGISDLFKKMIFPDIGSSVDASKKENLIRLCVLGLLKVLFFLLMPEIIAQVCFLVNDYGRSSTTVTSLSIKIEPIVLGVESLHSTSYSNSPPGRKSEGDMVWPP